MNDSDPRVEKRVSAAQQVALTGTAGIVDAVLLLTIPAELTARKLTDDGQSAWRTVIDRGGSTENAVEAMKPYLDKIREVRSFNPFKSVPLTFTEGTLGTKVVVGAILTASAAYIGAGLNRYHRARSGPGEQTNLPTLR